MMQKFWYNSPVKFYRIDSDFDDVLNPQNVQSFGEIKPYILEKGVLHRFLIPEHNNETDFHSNFDLYVVSGLKKTKILSDVGIIDSKIKYITFYCNQNISGFLQLQYGNDVLYRSNCIRFADTSQSERKQARIITKHNYNRQLFDFDSEFSWFVTNVPIYEDGDYQMDAEITNERIGGISTLQTSETYLDEVVNYQIAADGNGDIINFIQSSLTNTDFFLNGTKRTSTDKLDIDDNGIFAGLKLVNVKDENGFNISIDEDVIFSDLNIVEESRFPVNQSVNTEANIAILNNRISVTFNKVFVIQPNREAKIYKDGVLVYTKSSNNMYSDNYTLIINDTLLNSSDLVLTEGYYTVVLDSAIVRTGFGRTNLQITNWTFQISENEETLDFIQWIDGGTQDKIGNDAQVSVYRSDFSYDFQWQYFDGSDFVDVINGESQTYIFNLNNGLNQFRNIAIDTVTGISYVSNVLKYTKSNTPTLVSVLKLNTNTGRFVWNNNGIDYGAGSAILQLSQDNGLNWQNFFTTNPGHPTNNNSVDVSSAVLSSIINNTTVKFRIICSGNGLVNQISNTIDLIWQKTAKIYIPQNSVVKDTNGNLSYQLHVEDAAFEGFAISQTDIVENVRRISAVFTFGDNITPTLKNTVTKVKSITLQPNIYTCNTNLSIVPLNLGQTAEGQCIEAFSYTPNLGDSICSEYAINIINPIA